MELQQTTLYWLEVLKTFSSRSNDLPNIQVWVSSNHNHDYGSSGFGPNSLLRGEIDEVARIFQELSEVE